MEFVGVDIGTEHLTGGLSVFAQQRGTGKADEYGVLHPPLHLFVHIATLGPVAFIDKDVKTPMNRRRVTLKVKIELVD